VPGLETTATFDKAKGEFVIHSPTVSSAKFWPGDMGLTCTHALVYAKLIIEGKKFGVHPFIVPIRSRETHEPLPGCEMGDIGAKFGYNSKENGYLLFEHVRIPRDYMLGRYAFVD